MTAPRFSAATSPPTMPVPPPGASPDAAPFVPPSTWPGTSPKGVLAYDPAGVYAYRFGATEPVAEVERGQVLVTTTEDCFGGVITTVEDLPSRVCRFDRLNPVTGPFHVRGAEPGDTLAVHVLDITPARPFGVSSTFPHFGALTGTGATAMLHPPLPERVWLYPIDPQTGTVFFQTTGAAFTAALPLRPMLGTIGVAPAGGEVRSSIVPDRHGGNLDVPAVGPGTTLYLGVNVPGALLAFGDGHARQGSGEVSGVAVEIPTRTTLAVEVVKGVPTPWPRLQTDATLTSIGAARPLEDAFRISHHDLVRWVAELTGLEELDALQLVAQAGHADVGNVCDPNYTMLASIALQHLGATTVYDGVHQRLRATRLPDIDRSGGQR
ncbi:acetamidase/formamidase family protein [Cryptosporangium minutisporangium]|uniref:Acetamidase/formamidase family protein n=1 Tax=Cryptosporangium minutisporangium TaxID=113569 RepID=A0ABP6T0S5_9ACTN